MRKMLMATAMAVGLVVGAGGNAHATEGWYGRIDAGYTVDGSIEILNTDVALDEGDWMVSGGLGYAFQNGFRLEGEIANRGDELEIGGADVDALSLMLNLYYDFNRGGAFEPYVGVGVGGADVEFAGDEDESWAYQGLVGVAIGLGERLDLDVGYRYLKAEDLELFGVETEYEHQAVTVGLRWQFSTPYVAPPPPPPPPPPQPTPTPAPAACPTSEFVVYFEWDRSNLNQAAVETIEAAAARARQCSVGSVVVVGHTDTSGSTAYNEGLSERRASVVRDALVERGIAAASITTDARGETDLARPTGDGVREPLNRRTAVTISFR
jgi:outer membrane protein OmpA-like peptidoglycan-associated protein